MALIESQEKLIKGDKAPDFTLLATDGNKYSLDQIKGQKATLIIFMCNHCPYVKPKLEEMNRIAQDFKTKGVQVIGINSNDATNYPEDSFEMMQQYVKTGKIEFLYLYDEIQTVAQAYGAMCTPDPFLFDAELKLLFHSRLDDTHGDIPAKSHEMYEAIKEYLQDDEISLEQMPAMGCSIKWKHD